MPNRKATDTDFRKLIEMLPNIIQKDMDSNLVQFIFLNMFNISPDEQKEDMIDFIDKLSKDCQAFFTQKAKADFDISEKDLINLDNKTKTLLQQHLAPILAAFDKYKKISGSSNA